MVVFHFLFIKITFGTCDTIVFIESLGLVRCCFHDEACAVLVVEILQKLLLEHLKASADEGELVGQSATVSSTRHRGKGSMQQQKGRTRSETLG